MSVTTILPEYRFPLHLESSLDAVWKLYHEGKQSRWEPSRSITWPAADRMRERYGGEVLAAARLVWSHQVWRLFGRLTESPALLVRFCLERDRESDPKYFLSMRCTEDAKHVDACDRFAKCLGGLIDTPADREFAAGFTQSLFRDALDAAHALDAYLAAHVAWADAIDAALLEALRDAATDPTARELLTCLAADRRRQAAFGWHYVARRAPGWHADDIAAIERRLEWVDRNMLASGVLTPWLSDTAPAREVADAHALAGAAGLGGLDRVTALATIDSAVTDCRRRFQLLQPALRIPIAAGRSTA